MGIEEREISLQDITNILKNYWKLIVIPSVLAACIALIISSRMSKTYESYSLLKVGFTGSQSLETASSTQAIMDSWPMRKRIAEEINATMGGNQILTTFGGTIVCEDISGFLKIKVYADSPQKAAQYTQIVTKVVFERHQALYNESQKRMRELIKTVREIIQPIPLSAGINELRSEPTRIEVGPQPNDNPVAPDKKKIVSVTFFSVLFLNILLAFYLESRGEK